MHYIKENLEEELQDLDEKIEKNPNAKMSLQELQRAHLATDTVKNICKIETMRDGGYSEATDFMGEGRMYGTSYEGGSSYARGRGRNAKRDSMGRYSREGGYSEDGHSYAEGNRGGNMRGGMQGGRGGYSRDGAKEDMIEKAEEMMEMAQNEHERRAIKEFIKKLENA